jgi:prepilin-type N-terminal cleavage/methylation domain-containing protein/prepilin-type processing-associated H-X9-DG protein
MKTFRPFSIAAVRGRAAFTLLELAVVLAMIALLATISVPALAGTKSQTRVAQCAGNLKQYAMALHMFGSENNDKLPVNSGGFGSWAWDMAWITGNSITQYVSFRKMYCPGTSVRFTDQDNANLWNWSPGNLHVVGYVAPIPSSPFSSPIIATNLNTTLTPQRTQVGSVFLPAPSPAARVLVADATISTGTSDNHAGFVAGAKYNFTSVVGGYSVPHISPHLNGLTPAGGNLAMLDGHVTWRNFSDMDQRAITGIGFWW